MTVRLNGCAVHSFLLTRSQMDATASRDLATSIEIRTGLTQLQPRCARSPVGALSVLLTIR